MQEGVRLDVEAVLAYANEFAQALVSEERELIASYLTEELEASVSKILDAMPRPVRKVEVLNVNSPQSGESVCVTRFSGPQEEVLLRAIWIESHQQLLMRTAQIVGRKDR